MAATLLPPFIFYLLLISSYFQDQPLVVNTFFGLWSEPLVYVISWA
jgi:hypothetical protein